MYPFPIQSWYDKLIFRVHPRNTLNGKDRSDCRYATPCHGLLSFRINDTKCIARQDDPHMEMVKKKISLLCVYSKHSLHQINYQKNIHQTLLLVHCDLFSIFRAHNSCGIIRRESIFPGLFFFSILAWQRLCCYPFWCFELAAIDLQDKVSQPKRIDNEKTSTKLGKSFAIMCYAILKKLK